MSIVLFIVVLAVLVFVHELGHFLAAKSSGIRVDEFGLGFPPRVIGWRSKDSETLYSLNWVPFGGFVKIFGEDPDDESIAGPDKERSFIHKSKKIQAWVLAAGVIFNMILAWLLLSIAFMAGFPMSEELDRTGKIEDVGVTVVSVVENSPAQEAGLLIGDRVLNISDGIETISGDELSVDNAVQFIRQHEDMPVTVTYERHGIADTREITPTEGLVEGSVAIGTALDAVGTVQLPPYTALWEGLRLTGTMTVATAQGLGGFIHDAVTGGADFSQVAGPVGIVGLVGDAARLGFVQLITFTAFISLNLAVINLIPFPALDGGRILFVIIEYFRGRPISPKVANTLNTIGFGLLILLMVVVTYQDIARLFS